mmetsp:Transcript_29036/g.49851  ORF Transcript_29036/g.49851 Transcript_29036/m.49851 type:complete len:205 (-) Transcript_29036:437-1051(-)
MAGKERGSGLPLVEDVWDGRLGVGSYQIIPSSSSSISFLASLRDVPSNPINEVPCVPFPSLDPKNRRRIEEAQKVTPTGNITNASSVAFALKPEVVKRPVGRPRIHPIKYVDPNRVKRVARGDKPLGRPRTSHLKPPKVKRPIGRPRKDASKEIILTPMDELVRTALTEEWRNSFALSEKDSTLTTNALLPNIVSDVSLTEKNC